MSIEQARGRGGRAEGRKGSWRGGFCPGIIAFIGERKGNNNDIAKGCKHTLGGLLFPEIEEETEGLS